MVVIKSDHAKSFPRVLWCKTSWSPHPSQNMPRNLRLKCQCYRKIWTKRHRREGRMRGWELALEHRFTYSSLTPSQVATFIGVVSSHLVDELTLVCRRKPTHRITEVTNEALNSPDHERLEHPVSTAHPAISSPFPSRPESILIDGHSLTEEQPHLGTRREFTNGGRCTYIFRTMSWTHC